MVVITGKYKYNFSTNIQLQLVSVLVYPMILLYRYMYYKINPQAASNYGLTSGVQQCYLWVRIDQYQWYLYQLY